MRSFLIFVSGARTGDLDRLPAEQAGHEELGAAILIAAVTTGVLLAFGLHEIMNVPVATAVLAAVLTVLVLAYGDRWFAISTAPLAGRRLFMAALPRILFGILLAGLLSSFPVMQIFRQSISTQVATIQKQAADAASKAIINGPLEAQINFTLNQIRIYQEVINSGGGSQANPSQDGILRNLLAQLKHAKAVEAQSYEQFQCELFGGPGCVAGAGPQEKAAQERYLVSRQQVSDLQKQVTAREQELTASSVTATRVRLDEARRNLPGAQALLESDQASLSAEQHAASLIRERPAGLLTRLEALDQLSVRDSTLNTARLVVALLFISLECLPVLVILLTRRGSRERFLKTARADELRLAGVEPGVLELTPDDTPVPAADSYDLALRGMREAR